MWIFQWQWSDKKAYTDTLLKLGGLFKKNFEVFMNHKIGKDNKLTEEILAAGPIFWSEASVIGEGQMKWNIWT